MFKPGLKISFTLLASAFWAANLLWLGSGWFFGVWDMVTSPQALGYLILLNLGSLGTIGFFIRSRHYQYLFRKWEKEAQDLLNSLTIPSFYLKNSLDHLIILDKEDRIIYQSPGFRDLLGYPPENLFQQNWSLVDPAHYPGKLDQIRDQQSEEESVTLIQDLRPKDGPYRSVKITLRPTDKPVPGALALFIRPQDNQDLAPELTKDFITLKQIWNALPPIVLRDSGGREMLENKAFHELKTGAGGTLNLPGYLRTSDQLGGGYWELDSFGVPQAFEILRFSLPEYWGSIFLQATTRRDQERDLRESQAFLQTTIKQSPLGIIILDAKNTLVKICNNGAKEILGIPLNKDITGKPLASQEFPWEIFDLDHKPFKAERDPFLRAFVHRQIASDQVIIHRADGKERYVVLTSAPVYDQNGKFFAAFLALLDASELHKTEEQLQDLNRQLEDRVNLRTQELVETQRQLVEAEKLAGLGSLVAGVAHEINTPVGVGVTAASFLAECTQDLLNNFYRGQMKKSDLEIFLKGAEDSTKIILTNLNRASHLIRNFKMISVDQSSDLKRKFLFKNYLEDTFQSLPAPNRHLKLDVLVDGDERLELNSFPGAFSQIITNLYMNSCIHGFENRKEGKILLKFAQENQKIQLIYSDDGRGMDEATLQRVFDPFFTTRRHAGGTGLGMNIVFNLVNTKLGGRIKAESHLGEGVTFTLSLPLDPPTSPTIASEFK